jgi:hypothetical protein
MSDMTVKELSESIHRLAATELDDSKLEERVREVITKVSQLKTAVVTVSPQRHITPAKTSFNVENLSVIGQIDEMRRAAVGPAENYGRVVSILDGLRHIALLAERPQNVAVRPRIAEIVKKVAGVFAQVDTVQDLNKPLEQIEKAVHSLYGNQSSNSCYYFDRRGKGHHSDNA